MREGRSGRGFGHDRGSDRFLPIGVPPNAFADSAPALLPGHLVVAAGRVEGGSEREMDDVGEAGAEQVMTCVASRVFSLDTPSAALLRPKTVVHSNCPADALVLNQIQDLVARTLGPCRWCCTARARQPLSLCRLAPEFGTMQRLSRR